MKNTILDISPEMQYFAEIMGGIAAILLIIIGLIAIIMLMVIILKKILLKDKENDNK